MGKVTRQIQEYWDFFLRSLYKNRDIYHPIVLVPYTKYCKLLKYDFMSQKLWFLLKPSAIYLFTQHLFAFIMSMSLMFNFASKSFALFSWSSHTLQTKLLTYTVVWGYIIVELNFYVQFELIFLIYKLERN